MSHSSGIPVSESLKKTYGESLQNTSVRFIKCAIENDQVVEKQVSNGSDNWEADLDTVLPLLEKDQACYVLFRLDTKSSTGGFNWIIMCYVPDKCKVKDKMIYASTRSNLKLQLGAGNFSDEVFGTVPADFSKSGYQQHVIHKKTDAPLTETEQIKQREVGEVYAGVSSTYVHGVAFPVLAEATTAMQQLVSGGLQYVQLGIDIAQEKITCEKTSGSFSLGDFPSHVPTDNARFHFFAYQHEYEGQQIRSLVFVFSCPDGSKGTKSAPVKQRMLYSSSKANVSNILSTVGGAIAAKFEINAPDDLSEDQVFETLHPKPVAKKEAFSKPSRPGKGGARLTTSKKE